MKKNKGFTLIELLTVIAILAVILLIAAPTILGVLDKAKKNTFKNQVLLYVEGLKQQVALASIGTSDMTITLPTEGNTIEVDITKIPMDTNPGFTGNIIVENKGNGKYTYTLSNVASSDYKVNGNVVANELTVDNIIKASETTTPSEPEIPVTYYEFGDPTTDSTTDYKTLGKNVFVSLEGEQKSVCIVRNGDLICFKNNNWDEEKNRVQQAFSDVSCDVDSSGVNCDASDFGCYVSSNGHVSCYDYGSDESCNVVSDGSVRCG